jgi:hypothetical protein
MVRIETEEEACKRRFPGSPTIRIDGRNLFQTEELADEALGCRVYVTIGC